MSLNFIKDWALVRMDSKIIQTEDNNMARNTQGIPMEDCHMSIMAFTQGMDTNRMF